MSSTKIHPMTAARMASAAVFGQAEEKARREAQEAAQALAEQQAGATPQEAPRKAPGADKDSFDQATGRKARK